MLPPSMNWPLYSRGQSSSRLAISPEHVKGSPSERTGRRRVLSDISNTTAAAGNGPFGGAGGSAEKCSLLEPQTPARRAKLFTVFDDGADTMDSKPCPSSRPRQEGAPERTDRAGSNQEAFPTWKRSPPIDSFGNMEEQIPSMGLEGMDEYDAPEELADALLMGLRRQTLEDERRETLGWAEADLHLASLASTPGDSTSIEVWPSLAPEAGKEASWSPSRAMLSPLRLSMDGMDVDSDNDVRNIDDGCYRDVRRPLCLD
mmetsp:Transcript_47005/g.102288  ORF Transcript_47005/g.102288 Transcript_47005/m.102288 type:complete len:259 (-) Transcript_47005:98-874(-)